MHKLYTFNDLNQSLIDEYKSTVKSSFPKVIFQSEVVKNCWPIIEKYFPEYQVFYVDANDRLIGFINSIPIYWEKPLDELPEEGWDWLVERGIKGFEKNIKPNCLGGLQIIVSKNYLGKGFSRLLVSEGKRLKNKMGFKNFIIPIRPTFKDRYPEMSMEEYIDLKVDNKIYDPWIRTHLSSGAQIIKVCHNAMNITGGVNYWENLMKRKITESGKYIVEGALNPVMIQIEKNFGEYREDNIWINYT